jgi:drug/metabolite transporter (DMT)-like permease
MSLDPGVLALVLLAAALHASWNALVKAGGDRLAVLAITMGAPSLLLWLALPFVPAPAVAAWPYLFASVVVHTAYYACLIHAYRHGDLSQVYPIARGTAPLLVAAGAWALAGEALSPAELAGVLILCGGIVSLAWRRNGPAHDGEVKAVGFALLTSLMIGLYSVTDGLGVRGAGTAAGYIFWLFAIEGLPLLFYALWRRRGRIRAAFAPSLKAGLGGAVISCLAYGIVIWAMSLGPMAHVVALRETSVIMAAALGALVLKEPFGHRRIAAAAVVAGGAVLLQAG